MKVSDTPHRKHLLRESRIFLREWRKRSQMVPAISHAKIALAAFVTLAVIASVAWYFDAAVARAARGLPAYVHRLFGLITMLGSSGYIFVISAYVAILAGIGSNTRLERRYVEGLRLLAGRATVVFAITATSGIASQVIKHLVGRTRPRLLDSLGAFHFDPLTFKAVQASFPSGHTITAFAVAWTIGLFAPRWRIPLFSVAVLVGLSRVAIGAHYPADVLAGAVIGLAAAWITCRSFASRRLVVEYNASGITPRGRGLIVPALRAATGAGKAPV